MVLTFKCHFCWFIRAYAWVDVVDQIELVSKQHRRICEKVWDNPEHISSIPENWESFI